MGGDVTSVLSHVPDLGESDHERRCLPGDLAVSLELNYPPDQTVGGVSYAEGFVKKLEQLASSLVQIVNDLPCRFGAGGGVSSIVAMSLSVGKLRPKFCL